MFLVMHYHIHIQHSTPTHPSIRAYPATFIPTYSYTHKHTYRFYTYTRIQTLCPINIYAHSHYFAVTSSGSACASGARHSSAAAASPIPTHQHDQACSSNGHNPSLPCIVGFQHTHLTNDTASPWTACPQTHTLPSQA